MTKKLGDIASYSKERISIEELTLDNYISTDNLLQEKKGKTKAEKLPPYGGMVTKYEEGDILIANIRPYLKKIWYSKGSGGSSSDVLTLRVDDSFDSEFVFYSLFRDDFFNYVMKGSKGTKMPRGDKNQVLDFPVPSYSKGIQNKIAKVLSDLDAKIELNSKINAELEAMAKLIYDYWFVQFDFPDENGKPYKSSEGQMVYNEELKRDIPEGWEVKEVEDVIDRIIDHRGKTPKKLGGDWSNEDDSIIALSAKIVKGGKLRNLDQANRVNRELYDKWMSEKLIDGDVLMTSEAPAGEFYFIYGMTEYCLSQRLFALRANPSIVLPSYFYYELSSGYGYYQIMGSLSGSTVFGIRQDVLRTIKVVVPERGIQTRFDSIVLPQLKKIKEIEKENAKLTELRDWLLPMLMNGQVTVN